MPSPHDSRPRVVFVIPALDEEDALGAVLAEIPEGMATAVVVCDNGSSDSTADVARAGGAHVVRDPRRGYGQACLTALDAVLARGSVLPAPGAPFGAGDIVVFLDADHSDYPADAPSIVAPIVAREADLVIGSRHLGGATAKALLPQAWFGNKLACFLMRVLFGARYTDLGPFRAITLAALEHLDMGDRDFGWTVEMQLKAKVAGLRTAEVPVRYRERIGRSKITGTVLGTLRAGWKILGWILGWRVKLLIARRSVPRYRSPAPVAPR